MKIAMSESDSNMGNSLSDIVLAAYNGNAKLVASLLSQNADVNSVDPGDNLSILHIACMQGDDLTAQAIIAHGEKYHNVDFSILTFYRPRLAWQMAMNRGHYGLARKIIIAKNNAENVLRLHR